MVPDEGSIVSPGSDRPCDRQSANGNSLHSVPEGGRAVFTWDYEANLPELVKLYQKAKRGQWDAETDVDWSISVDQEMAAVGAAGTEAAVRRFRHLGELDGSPFRAWGHRQWLQLAVETANWRLSQILHGEQGALLCSAKLVSASPSIEAKHCAAMQVADEARHIEVFKRYLDEKLSGHYAVNPHLAALLDDILKDSRWDLTYLGMQIMVEGLALATFAMVYRSTTEPLLKAILKLVMADEARHVAFGVVALGDFYQGLSAAEIRERQEFAFDAAIRMRDRLVMREVWERMGVDAKAVERILLERRPGAAAFQAMLFSKVVPNCKKLGLLDAGDGWLRQRFREIGVMHFEHQEDWLP